MVDYNQPHTQLIKSGDQTIYSFTSASDQNIDHETVRSFGEEWNKFSSFSADDIQTAGDQYFDIVDDSMVNDHSLVLDAGCGSGRWSKYLSERARFIEAIDPSESVFAAAQLTREAGNIRITHAGIDNIPFPDNTFDFVFCLGVLHHIPDTQAALEKIVRKLKSGGHLLLYLYYNLDNRSTWYKWLFRASDIIRRIISSLPQFWKKLACDIIALTVYLPLITVSRIMTFLFRGQSWTAHLPLSYYNDKSYNIVRNDALDRFGTPLEKRYSKAAIQRMMEAAGIQRIRFSPSAPYWHAVGEKSPAG